ncbi:unnamed protein product [Calypogeia fissa]
MALPMNTTEQSQTATQLFFSFLQAKSFDPIIFEGDRTVKDFVKFLKKEAAIPFTVPKKPESSPAAELTTESAEQHISEAESSSSKSAEPELESVIEDSWSSRKDSWSSRNLRVFQLTHLGSCKVSSNLQVFYHVNFLELSKLPEKNLPRSIVSKALS